MGKLAQSLGLTSGDPKPVIPDGSDMPFLNLPAYGTPIDPSTAGQVYQATPDVTVTGWAPTKRNLLGRLADALSGTHTYEDRMEERDMASAMKGFADDPLTAIKRIAQIPGQQGAAYKMYQEYTDNKASDMKLQLMQELRANQARNRISSMLGAANAQNYDKLYPLMVKYAQANGIDPAEIPQTYDPDNVNAYRMGGITVDQQIDNSQKAQYQTETLNQRQQRINNERDYQQGTLSERANYHKGVLENQDERIDKMPDKSKTGSKGGRTIQTKYGPGMMSPDGSQLVVITNGRKLGYMRVGQGANGQVQWKLAFNKPVAQ